MSSNTEQPAATATSETPVERLAAAVAELTDRKTRFCYVEHYDRKKKIRVRTKHKLGRFSMIDRLEADVARDDDTAPKDAAGGLAAGFDSRPPGAYRPRELLMAFTNELAVWLAWVGLDERNGLEDHLRGLLAVAPKMVDAWPVDLANMVQDIERWTGQIRRYCGYERMSHPRATCPRCNHFGALTIWSNEETRRAERGRCARCGNRWDQVTVGILLEHVFSESKRTRRPKPVRREPPPTLCPRCGQSTEVSAAGGRRCAGTRASDGRLLVAPCGLEIVAA